jgi:4-amino-4-deoxy-L-arabinose transferase-like glycosyltransferase
VRLFESRATAGTALAVLLVTLVGAVLILPRLGHRQLIGSHEAVFPVVARDIVERHAWLGADLRGLPYRNKPPLYPWAIAVSSWSTGRVTEVTARLPGALAAIGAAVATCLLGVRLFGTRAGLWAALILLTSIVFFDHALVTIPDVPMVLFDLLAGLALWSVSNGGGRGALLGFYAALALAVFTKGVPGLLALAVAVVWLGVDEGRRGLRRLAWRPGVLLFAATTGVWVVPYAATGRGRFATDVVWDDWLWSMLGAPHPATLAVQAIDAALAFLPWTLLLPVAVSAAIRARRSRPVLFVLCWLVVQAVLVFAMQQQRVRYLLPLLPGAALLVAWWADREATTAPPHRALAAGAVGAALVGALAAALAVPRLDMAPAAPRWEIASVLIGVVVVGVLAAGALWTGRLAVAVTAVAASAAILLPAGGWIVDEWCNRAWDYRAVARDLGAVAEPLAVAALADDHELLQLDFYLGRPLPLLRSPEAVATHLIRTHGAVVVETERWRTAAQWLPLDPGGLRTRAIGADIVVVTEGRR